MGLPNGDKLIMNPRMKGETMSDGEMIRDQDNEINELRIEIAQLKEKLQTTATGDNEYINTLRQRCEDLQAENAKLRDSVERVLSDGKRESEKTDNYVNELRDTIVNMKAMLLESRSVIEILLPYLHQIWGMETEDRFESRQEAKIKRADQCLESISQFLTP